MYVFIANGFICSFGSKIDWKGFILAKYYSENVCCVLVLQVGPYCYSMYCTACGSLLILSMTTSTFNYNGVLGCSVSWRECQVDVDTLLCLCRSGKVLSKWLCEEIQHSQYTLFRCLSLLRF